MPMRIDEANVRGWPGLRLGGRRLELGLIPGLGGRIASLTHDGEELLFVQPEHRGERVNLEGELRALKSALGFRLWGGNKTWVAPQHAWLDGIPPLDLDAGAYRAETGDAVTMVSPVCRETGLQVTRRVDLEADDTVVLEHSLGPTPPEAEAVYVPDHERDQQSGRQRRYTDSPLVFDPRELWRYQRQFQAAPSAARLISVESFARVSNQTHNQPKSVRRPFSMSEPGIGKFLLTVAPPQSTTAS